MLILLRSSGGAHCESNVVIAGNVTAFTQKIKHVYEVPNF